MGGIPDTRQQRSDGVYELLPPSLGCRVEGRLNDVVGKAILQELFHLTRHEKLIHNHVLGHVAGTAQTLLDDVGTELVARQLANAGAELRDDRLGVFGLVEINDVLHHIIAEGVLHQDVGVIRDLLNENPLLRAIGVIDAALDDTASVAVGADLDTVMTDSVEDELSILRRQLVKALLDDMVPVQILDERDDIKLQSFNDELSLDRTGDELNHPLKCAGSMLIEGDLHHFGLCITDECCSLLRVAILEQLLAEIVAEGIRHEVDNMAVSLLPDGVGCGRVAFVKLLLQVPAAVLILGKTKDVLHNRLKRHVDKSVHCCA
jgi:hypothetical protein